MPFWVWGLIALDPWITAFGLAVQILGKRWFLDRWRCCTTMSKVLVCRAATVQSETMTEQWIKGCVVQRIMFRDGLVLSLDAYNELIISVPFHLRLPKIANGDEEVVVVDPKAMKNEERPLFDFAGQTITHADWDEDGGLHLGFSDGHEIHARSNERRTAWELYGKYHGYAACLPRGEVRVVRHDLAEEDDN